MHFELALRDELVISSSGHNLNLDKVPPSLLPFTGLTQCSPMLPWFSNKSQDLNTDKESRTGLGSTQPSTAQAVDSNPQTSAKQASKSTITAVSTPHDELLAQIHGKRPQRRDAVKPNSPEIPDLTSPHLLRHDSTHPNPNLDDPFAEHQGPGSTAMTYSTVRTSPDLVHHDLDILSDPFDGKELGVLKADPYDITQLEPGELSSKNEDMWMHLSRISELQNDIAIMHARMEGIGSNTGDKKGKKPLRRDWDDKGAGSRSQTNMANEGGEDEGVGVQGDEETEKVKAREEEFSRLADKFTGRKDAIDQIMYRVTFHLAFILLLQHTHVTALMM